MNAPHHPDLLLTVVIPAYNEEEVLREFHGRLAAVLDAMPLEAEIVYVNDGSRDNSLAVLEAMRVMDPRIAIVDLSRNFGKEAALTAGLEHASGDAVVVIDADLQDPPELIPELVRYWREGHDMVYAQRTHRDGESCAKRLTAHLFYRLIERVSEVAIPRDTGDFRLLSRRAVDALLALPERHRFMKGLFAWVGFAQKSVPYRRDRRRAGHTKWNYWRLWNFALEGITSFTTVPLKVATYVGTVTAGLAFLFGAYVIATTLLFGNPVSGYPSVITAVLFLGGVQLTALGVIGEYLGRLSDEAKGRPLYLVNDYRPARLASGMRAIAQPDSLADGIGPAARSGAEAKRAPRQRRATGLRAR